MSETARRRLMSGAVTAGLIVSAGALAWAPALMPAGYSPISHTTSESAAQGVDGAWLARLGFLLFGLSVTALALVSARRWGWAGAVLHYLFGAFMAGAAAFSTRPWTGAPFDPFEDVLHSIAATAMGFAFAAGVLAVALRRSHRWSGHLLDIIAVIASVAVPLAMAAAPSMDGVAQRVMFAVAYIWYGAQVVPSGHKHVPSADVEVATAGSLR